MMALRRGIASSCRPERAIVCPRRPMANKAEATSLREAVAQHARRPIVAGKEALEKPGEGMTVIRKVDRPSITVNIGNTEAVRLEQEAFQIMAEFDKATDPYAIRNLAEKAIEKLDAALKASPHNVQLGPLHHGKALCYIRLGDWSKAQAEAKAAIEADEAFVPAFESLGESLMMQGMYKEAIPWFTKFFDTFIEYYSHFEESKKLNSEEMLSKLLFKRGVCYFKVPDYICAAGDFNSVVELGGKQVAASYNWLGKIAFENGKYWEAVSLHTKAIEANPESVSAYSDRNLTYTMLGKKEEAEEDRRQMNLIKRKLVWKKF